MKAILFDLFGVIARDQSAAGRLELQAIGLGYTARSASMLPRTEAARVAEFWDAYWSRRPDYDRGLTDAPAYWRQVGHVLGAHYDDRQVQTLLGADLISWSTVDPHMVTVLGSLRSKGVRLALLSNTPIELAERYEASHAWFDAFEFVGFSSRLGTAKPDDAAYQQCLDALGLPASEVVMVDDRQSNIDAASAMGMRTHLFTTPNDFLAAADDLL